MAFMVQLGVKGMALLGVTPNLKQSEHHSWENTITSNTIESGAEIQDHIVIGPLVIKETFIISILGRFDVLAALETAPPIYLLMQLRKSKQIIDVVTNCGIFKNMAIQSIEAETVEGTVNTITCTITFREVMQASISDGVVKSSSTISEKTRNIANSTKNMASRAPVSSTASLSSFFG
jgi:hypothetical protein